MRFPPEPTFQLVFFKQSSKTLKNLQIALVQVLMIWWSDDRTDLKRLPQGNEHYELLRSKLLVYLSISFYNRESGRDQLHAIF